MGDSAKGSIMKSEPSNDMRPRGEDSRITRTQRQVQPPLRLLRKGYEGLALERLVSMLKNFISVILLMGTVFWTPICVVIWGMTMLNFAEPGSFE